MPTYARRSRSTRGPTCPVPHFRSMAKPNRVSPAPTTQYCVPSSSYVIGPLLTSLPRFACHNGSPVSALSATKLFEGSPVKTRFPAVLRTPQRTADPSHLWLHRTLPVL